ncbi:MAG: hypothetical protein WDW38_001326 [Sanguina aurantia]
MVLGRATTNTSTGKVYTLFSGTNPAAWVPKTWASAEVACRNQDAGHLASFQTDEQWGAVTTLANVAFLNLGSRPILLWIGLNNLRTATNAFSDGSNSSYTTSSLTVASSPVLAAYPACKAAACYAVAVTAMGVNTTLLQVDCDAASLAFICSSASTAPPAVLYASPPPYPPPPSPALLPPPYPPPPRECYHFETHGAACTKQPWLLHEGVIATSRRLLATMLPSMSPPSYPATYGSSPSSYPSPASYPAISYPPTACPSLAGGAITALSDVSPYEYFLLTTPLTWSEAVKACTTRSASLAYITTPAELAAVTAFMTANAVRNAWLQLVSSNMVPFPQYYDDVSAGHTQYAMLAAAANGSTLPLVLTASARCNPASYSVGCCGFLQMSGNGTSVVLDSCTVSHSIVCKWTPSPPPPMPYPPPVMAPPAVSLANVATFVSTMSATLQLDYASLVADPAKLASFMTSYSAAILASLKNAKACNVTGVQSGSVVVAYTVTFLASDFASTDALSAYIATTFGNASNFFSLFPTSFTSAFNVTGASNVILAVGYACTGSGCPSTAAKKDDKPLIIGLVVAPPAGGSIAISTGSAVTAMQAAPESPAAAASDMMAAKATPPPAPIPFPVLAPKATVVAITPEPESPRLAPGPAAPVHAAGAEASVATPEPAKPVLTSERAVSEPTPERASLGQPEADSHATIPGNVQS